MAFSNYQHGFKNGVTIRGIPVEISHPGKVFWVGNNATRLDNEKTAADGNDGTFLAPYATVMAAYAACAASRGDVIFVRAGYTETLTTTSWTLNKAGVAIVGLGAGSLRPTLTLDGTADTINVSAASNSIRNFICNSTVASLVAVVTLTTALDFSMEDCLIKESGSGTILKWVVTASTANAADGLYLARNVFKTTAVGTAGVIALVGDIARVTVIDNYIHSQQTGAIIVQTTATNATELVVRNNILRSLMTAATGLVYGAGAVSASLSTGVVADNIIKCIGTTSTMLVVHAESLGLVCSNNVHQKALGSVSAREIPVAETVD